MSMNLGAGHFSPYLRNCTEESDLEIAHVEGHIPKWVSGCFLRNGPGMRSINGEEYAHLFDGLSLIQKVTIKSGRVTYKSKFLHSDSYVKNVKYNRIVVSEFGTNSYPDPCKSIFDKFTSYFTLGDVFTDNDLVNFYFIGDQLYATSDSPYIRRIDPVTLETFERVDLKKVVHVATATSHPHTDCLGNTFNVGSNLGSYNITAFPASGGLSNGRIITQIATTDPLYPSYYHSFLMTAKYFIFIEQPLIISIPSVIYQNRIIRGVNSKILKWKPHLGTRFYVVDRQTNQVLDQVYTAKAFAFFHTINAYEKDNHLVCDIVTYRDASFLNTLYVDAIKRASVDLTARKLHRKYLQSKADRFVLPLLSKHQRKQLPVGLNINQLAGSRAVACVQSDGSICCSPEALTVEGETVAEMPAINYKYYNGREYRYFYGFARSTLGDSLGLMKVDTETKKCLTWFDQCYYPSEGVFVPKDNASLLPEDDGVLLSLVINLNDETNGFVLVLNASNFTELARASFNTAAAIPPGFHGIFIPNGSDEDTDTLHSEETDELAVS